MRALASFCVVNYNEEETLEIHSAISDSESFQPAFLEVLSLKPKTNVTISVSYFPHKVGEISGNIILSTNFGTFLYNVKGCGVNNPYLLPPSIKDKVSILTLCTVNSSP